MGTFASRLVVVSLFAGLAGCSSSLCVQVDAVPDAQQAPVAGPACDVERLGAFTVATRSLDPGLGEMVALRSMTDAAVLAGHLTRGSDTVLTDPPPTPRALQSLQDARQAWADVLVREAVVLDHHRALAEIGLRLAEDLEASRPDAAAFAARGLVDAWSARRHRILTDDPGASASTSEAEETSVAAAAPAPSSTPAADASPAPNDAGLPPPRVSSRPRARAPRALPPPAVVIVPPPTVARGP